MTGGNWCVIIIKLLEGRDCNLCRLINGAKKDCAYEKARVKYILFFSVRSWKSEITM